MALELSFLMATGNPHKGHEFHEILKKLSSNLRLTLAPKTIEIEENGTTFHENALIKAKGYFEKFKSPVMADDSGLVIQANTELLGLQTARFYPQAQNQNEKNLKLLEIMSDYSDRSAYFICVLCFYLSPKEIYFFEGRLSGEIANSSQGKEGFGYDPVFLPSNLPLEHQGLTLAQLGDWKLLNSHRGKALLSANDFFTKR